MSEVGYYDADAEMVQLDIGMSDQQVSNIVGSVQNDGMLFGMRQIRELEPAAKTDKIVVAVGRNRTILEDVGSGRSWRRASYSAGKLSRWTSCSS